MGGGEGGGGAGGAEELWEVAKEMDWVADPTDGAISAAAEKMDQTTELTREAEKLRRERDQRIKAREEARIQQGIKARQAAIRLGFRRERRAR